jgi:putative oxidoreductase
MSKLFAPTKQSFVADVALSLTRIVLGVLFVLHGWQKVTHDAGATGWLDEVHNTADFSPLTLALAAYLELLGGVLLTLGLLSRLGALFVIGVMVGATYHKYDPNKDLLGPDGPEMPLFALMLGLLFLTLGGGKLSVDQKLFGSKS